MNLLPLCLIAIGVSMDAFAVSVCKGLGMTHFNKKQASLLGIFFGGFQALMPLIGWAVGQSFSQYVATFDHWIAFALLLFIGGKMVIEALVQKDKTSTENCNKLSIKELFILAIATSIDALAVGITFAFIYPTVQKVLFPILLIGVTTYLFSFAGAYIGKQFGNIFKNKAQIIGGFILIGIGVKILIEHLLA